MLKIESELEVSEVLNAGYSIAASVEGKSILAIAEFRRWYRTRGFGRHSVGSVGERMTLSTEFSPHSPLEGDAIFPTLIE